MKFTLSWLKNALTTDASLQEICDKLTAIGLELEGLDDPAAALAPFKVAYVESAEKHPDADKLQVCQVKTDAGTLQVVCGAPNARAGMKGIFAPEKTYIPGLDVTLKKTQIRGVESNGMLVSEREMELSDEHEGIIEVDEKYEFNVKTKVYNERSKNLEVESNFTPVPRKHFRIGVDDACTLTLALNTDDGAYWGSNYEVVSTVKTQKMPWNERAHSAEITLPPLATVFYVTNVD